MRLLLWVLLVTLVTLLASTDAASSKMGNAVTTKTSKLESVQPPALAARGLSPGNIADGKRSLSGHDNDDSTDDDADDESYAGENDEERTIAISSILDRTKASMGKVKNSMSAVSARLDNVVLSMSAVRKRLDSLVHKSTN
nr:hypothetical protein KRP22_9087 [Phytophthora ramorum]